MVKVLFKRLNPKAQIPKYKTDGSSGLDLMALIEDPIKIKSQESTLIPTGISVAIPQDTEIQIRPRSGLAAKSNISVLILLELLIVIIEGKLKLYYLIMEKKIS
jgi:dUTP pyrophosphatase